MLTVYVISLLVGGFFVALSALAGDGEADAGGGEGPLSIELTDPAHGDHPNVQTLWLPFLSFVFWSYGVFSFGIAGCLLHWLTPGLGDLVIAAASAMAGLTLGTGAAAALRYFRQHEADSMPRPEEALGRSGTVEVPFARGQRGKVRMRIKGTLVDYTATTDDNEPLPAGRRVLVVGARGGVLHVVSEEKALGTLPPSETEPS